MDPTHPNPDAVDARTPLRILLIEDNPGDARLIEEMLREGTGLSDRMDRDSGNGHELRRAERLSEGVDQLDAERFDVVLLDLNLPDSRGLDTLAEVREHAERVPVVVLTGVSDQEIGVRALKRGAEEYLVKDEIGAGLLVRSVYHAIERAAYERELTRQRDQMAALNQLNGIVRATTHAVLQQSTRPEVERLVCERLAHADSYVGAWIGEVTRASEAVSVRTAAGVEDLLDAWENPADAAGTGRPLVDASGTDLRAAGEAERPSPTGEDGENRENAEGPIDRAIEAETVQVARMGVGEPAGWWKRVDEYGIASFTVIPIVYEDILYGVLNVYSDRPDAFDADEREVIAQLGEVVGHAINAIERKLALVGDRAVELVFQSEELAAPFEDVLAEGDASITLDRTLLLEDQNAVQYYTVSGADPETFEAAIEDVPAVESIRQISEVGAPRFEVQIAGEPPAEAFASHGGNLHHIRYEGSVARITAEFPERVDVGRVVDAVRTEYPDLELVAKNTRDREEEPIDTLRSTLESDLTDRQRATLEAAVYAGYFEWPRESSGEEIAESLGITSSTFHQHLRTAERKLLSALLQDGPEP